MGVRCCRFGVGVLWFGGWGWSIQLPLTTRRRVSGNGASCDQVGVDFNGLIQEARIGEREGVREATVGAVDPDEAPPLVLVRRRRDYRGHRDLVERALHADRRGGAAPQVERRATATATATAAAEVGGGRRIQRVDGIRCGGVGRHESVLD